MTKTPLKSGKISQKSSSFRGGKSDFPPILGGVKHFFTRFRGVYNIVTFSRGGCIWYAAILGGVTYWQLKVVRFMPPPLWVFLTASLTGIRYKMIVKVLSLNALFFCFPHHIFFLQNFLGQFFLLRNSDTSICN